MEKTERTPPYCTETHIVFPEMKTAPHAAWTIVGDGLGSTYRDGTVPNVHAGLDQEGS